MSDFIHRINNQNTLANQGNTHRRQNQPHIQQSLSTLSNLGSLFSSRNANPLAQSILTSSTTSNKTLAMALISALSGLTRRQAPIAQTQGTQTTNDTSATVQAAAVTANNNDDPPIEFTIPLTMPQDRNNDQIIDAGEIQKAAKDYRAAFMANKPSTLIIPQNVLVDPNRGLAEDNPIKLEYFVHDHNNPDNLRINDLAQALITANGTVKNDQGVEVPRLTIHNGDGELLEVEANMPSGSFSGNLFEVATKSLALFNVTPQDAEAFNDNKTALNLLRGVVHHIFKDTEFASEFTVEKLNAISDANQLKGLINLNRTLDSDGDRILTSELRTITEHIAAGDGEAVEKDLTGITLTTKGNIFEVFMSLKGLGEEIADNLPDGFTVTDKETGETLDKNQLKEKSTDLARVVLNSITNEMNAIREDAKDGTLDNEAATKLPKTNAAIEEFVKYFTETISDDSVEMDPAVKAAQQKLKVTLEKAGQLTYNPLVEGKSVSAEGLLGKRDANGTFSDAETYNGVAATLKEEFPNIFENVSATQIVADLMDSFDKISEISIGQEFHHPFFDKYPQFKSALAGRAGDIVRAADGGEMNKNIGQKLIDLNFAGMFASIQNSGEDGSWSSPWQGVGRTDLEVIAARMRNGETFEAICEDLCEEYAAKRGIKDTNGDGNVMDEFRAYTNSSSGGAHAEGVKASGANEFHFELDAIEAALKDFDKIDGAGEGGKKDGHLTSAEMATYFAGTDDTFATTEFSESGVKGEDKVKDFLIHKVGTGILGEGGFLAEYAKLTGTDLSSKSLAELKALMTGGIQVDELAGTKFEDKDAGRTEKVFFNLEGLNDDGTLPAGDPVTIKLNDTPIALTLKDKATTETELATLKTALAAMVEKLDGEKYDKAAITAAINEKMPAIGAFYNEDGTLAIQTDANDGSLYLQAQRDLQDLFSHLSTTFDNEDKGIDLEFPTNDLNLNVTVTDLPEGDPIDGTDVTELTPDAIGTKLDELKVSVNGVLDQVDGYPEAKKNELLAAIDAKKAELVGANLTVADLNTELGAFMAQLSDDADIDGTNPLDSDIDVTFSYTDIVETSSTKLIQIDLSNADLSDLDKFFGSIGEAITKTEGALEALGLQPRDFQTKWLKIQDLVKQVDASNKDLQKEVLLQGIAAELPGLKVADLNGNGSTDIGDITLPGTGETQAVDANDSTIDGGTEGEVYQEAMGYLKAFLTGVDSNGNPVEKSVGVPLDQLPADLVALLNKDSVEKADVQAAIDAINSLPNPLELTAADGTQKSIANIQVTGNAEDLFQVVEMDKDDYGHQDWNTATENDLVNGKSWSSGKMVFGKLNAGEVVTADLTDANGNVVADPFDASPTFNPDPDKLNDGVHHAMPFQTVDDVGYISALQLFQDVYPGAFKKVYDAVKEEITASRQAFVEEHGAYADAADKDKYDDLLREQLKAEEAISYQFMTSPEKMTQVMGETRYNQLATMADSFDTGLDNLIQELKDGNITRNEFAAKLDDLYDFKSSQVKDQDGDGVPEHPFNEAFEPINIGTQDDPVWRLPIYNEQDEIIGFRKGFHYDFKINSSNKDIVINTLLGMGSAVSLNNTDEGYHDWTGDDPLTGKNWTSDDMVFGKAFVDDMVNFGPNDADVDPLSDNPLSKKYDHHRLEMTSVEDMSHIGALQIFQSFYPTSWQKVVHSLMDEFKAGREQFNANNPNPTPEQLEDLVKQENARLREVMMGDELKTIIGEDQHAIFQSMVERLDGKLDTLINDLNNGTNGVTKGNFDEKLDDLFDLNPNNSLLEGIIEPQELPGINGKAFPIYGENGEIIGARKSIHFDFQQVDVKYFTGEKDLPTDGPLVGWMMDSTPWEFQKKLPDWMMDSEPHSYKYGNLDGSFEESSSTPGEIGLSVETEAQYGEGGMDVNAQVTEKKAEINPGSVNGTATWNTPGAVNLKAGLSVQADYAGKIALQKFMEEYGEAKISGNMEHASHTPGSLAITQEKAAHGGGRLSGEFDKPRDIPEPKEAEMRAAWYDDPFIIDPMYRHKYGDVEHGMMDIREGDFNDGSLHFRVTRPLANGGPSGPGHYEFAGEYKKYTDNVFDGEKWVDKKKTKAMSGTFNAFQADGFTLNGHYARSKQNRKAHIIDKAGLVTPDGTKLKVEELYQHHDSIEAFQMPTVTKIKPDGTEETVNLEKGAAPIALDNSGTTIRLVDWIDEKHSKDFAPSPAYLISSADGKWTYAIVADRYADGSTDSHGRVEIFYDGQPIDPNAGHIAEGLMGETFDGDGIPLENPRHMIGDKPDTAHYKREDLFDTSPVNPEAIVGAASVGLNGEVEASFIDATGISDEKFAFQAVARHEYSLNDSLQYAARNTSDKGTLKEKATAFAQEVVEQIDWNKDGQLSHEDLGTWYGQDTQMETIDTNGDGQASVEEYANFLMKHDEADGRLDGIVGFDVEGLLKGLDKEELRTPHGQLTAAPATPVTAAANNEDSEESTTTTATTTTRSSGRTNRSRLNLFQLVMSLLGTSGNGGTKTTNNSSFSWLTPQQPQTTALNNTFSVIANASTQPSPRFGAGATFSGKDFGGQQLPNFVNPQQQRTLG